jgi:hypothetical protein
VLYTVNLDEFHKFCAGGHGLQTMRILERQSTLRENIRRRQYSSVRAAQEEKSRALERSQVHRLMVGRIQDLALQHDVSYSSSSSLGDPDSYSSSSCTSVDAPPCYDERHHGAPRAPLLVSPIRQGSCYGSLCPQVLATRSLPQTPWLSRSQAHSEQLQLQRSGSSELPAINLAQSSIRVIQGPDRSVASHRLAELTSQRQDPHRGPVDTGKARDEYELDDVRKGLEAMSRASEATVALTESYRVQTLNRIHQSDVEFERLMRGADCRVASKRRPQHQPNSLRVTGPPKSDGALEREYLIWPAPYIS